MYRAQWAQPHCASESHCLELSFGLTGMRAQSVGHRHRISGVVWRLQELFARLRGDCFEDSLGGSRRHEKYEDFC